jgi:hypothetical protein
LADFQVHTKHDLKHESQLNNNVNISNLDKVKGKIGERRGKRTEGRDRYTPTLLNYKKSSLKARIKATSILVKYAGLGLGMVQ